MFHQSKLSFERQLNRSDMRGSFCLIANIILDTEGSREGVFSLLVAK